MRTVCACLLLVAASAATAAPINFNRDIRPIFSDRCFACHGPEPAKRQAGLRLDTEEGVHGPLPKHPEQRAFVPGKPDASRGFQRITSTKPDEQMPPPKSNLNLSFAEKTLIRRWIEEGAKWQPHWAFVKPERPSVPQIQDLKSTIQNPIDNFILARLADERLSPSPEADKVTLIRRVSLDLTGIPPTLAEVDAFLSDKSPDAYERAVDRLLASPRYGEQMALRWLDYARYADSHGYQADWERFMWRWRDWVITSFNTNMPFNQFTIEQLAGDLLPNPTVEQRIATGFNRNHRINTEGGIIAEEWRVETVVDRVDTTSSVWLGLTMGCARCHDHKYDPFSQKEYYRLAAFFNSVDETGIGDEKFGNVKPVLKLPTPEQQKRLDELNAEIKTADAKLKEVEPRMPGLQKDWEASGTAFPEPAGMVATNAVAFKRTVPFSYGCRAKLNGRSGALLSRMGDGPDLRGFDLFADRDKLAVHIIHKWPSSAIKVVTAKPVVTNVLLHVMATYDGSSKAAGVRLFINGKPIELKTATDTLGGIIGVSQPVRIGLRKKSAPFNGTVDDVRFYNRQLSEAEVLLIASRPQLDAIRRLAVDKRTPEQKALLAQAFRATNGDWNTACQHLDRTRRERERLEKEVPDTMVMQELPSPRETFVLLRGQYDKRGEKVDAGLPAALPPMPAGTPMNRLGLAQWIVGPANPLTARVLANRLWEKFFGTGLVKTTENLGSQAEWPSHPELLDWLATELVRLKWDLKAFQKLIVMSATYRQSSRVTQALLEKDPENRLLARAPRLRLPAETVRDQALAVSGLLVEKLGGPSVKPYMPAGLWDEVNVYGNLRVYVADKGEGLYRRTLYTFYKRTAAPPDMLLFDVPGREICAVKRSRTNTPLQALALLNEVTYVETARALGERMLTEGGATPAERITFAFRRATGRTPSDTEMKQLHESFKRQLAKFRKDNDAATKLLSVGEMKRNEKLDVAELAAATMTARVILNLDETVTRQ